ncbi:MAG: helix-turn-helix domain-containing protein [Gammaproteobacteria bacterium]|nr:helix-turn-helix domain-containing protein [Gammaproteobacteria bacterium]
MKKAKRQKLEAKGWKFGDATDFLRLSSEETRYIELKLTLGDNLKKQRTRRRLKQIEMAKLIKSSQSRVAKMEAGDPSVSLDLQIRSLLALGVSRKDIAEMIAPNARSKAA